MYFLLLKTFAHTLNIFVNNYLMPSLNRTENTAQYSINYQPGMLYYGMNGLHSTLAVAAQQSWSKFSWCGVGIRQAHLQELE